MARDQELPATAYVVLGLVSIRPMTGYELAGYAERSIGNFFPLTRSHIYSELDRLDGLGLLEATEIAQENAPTKRVHEITPAGSDELQRWLEGTMMSEGRSRNLFLVRIFFGDRTTPERLAALLNETRAGRAFSPRPARVDRGEAGRPARAVFAGPRQCSACDVSRPS